MNIRTCNKLEGQVAYLAGFIDANPEKSRGWRIDMKRFLNDLGIGAFDPTDKPITNVKVSEDKDFVQRMNSLKSRGMYDEITQSMKEIVRLDLKMVDLANFLILAIDKRYYSCGSFSEFTYACMLRKPVFVYCEQGVSEIPNWMFGLGDYPYFHGSWDSIKQHIQNIHDGFSDDLDGKWRFFNYDKVFGDKDLDFVVNKMFNP